MARPFWARFFVWKNLAVVFCWIVAVLQGIFEKSGCLVWCFCGELVDKCVANVDKNTSLFGC
jgi:hypothetical protein